MNSLDSRADLIKKIAECVNIECIEFVIVFGSILNEKFNHESDIDVAVMFKSDSDFQEKRDELVLKFYKLSNHDVDLIVLNNTDIIITMQALANGQLIFYRDIHEFNIFKSQKLSEYADFKLSRKLLESNFLKHKIYAGN
jgi:predicted nucleotidyltransferase